MIERLEESHFLAVVGSSGSGKSSLVKTGLLRGLEMGLLPQAGSHWCIIDFRPGGAPLRNLAKKMLEAERTGPVKAGLEAPQADAEVSDIDVDLMRGFLMHSPRSVIEWHQSQPWLRDSNLLLLVDQFEELFRYDGYEEREEAEAFVALLLESAQSARPRDAEGESKPRLRLYVTLTMRSDFLGACSLIEHLAEEINNGLYLTPRMTREQCREAIKGPARVCGFTVDEGLVNRLLNDLDQFAPWEGSDKSDQLDRIAKRADQLPLLQYTLNRMWELARGKSSNGNVVLRLEDYLSPEIRGLSGALNSHAREILGESGEAKARISPEDRPIVEAMFRALTVGPTVAEAVRRPTKLDELVQICGGNAATVKRVVDVFRESGCNFLSLSDDGIVDISHESLIRQWKHLAKWLEDEANAARLWRGLLDLRDRYDGRVLLQEEQLPEYKRLRDDKAINWAWAARYDQKAAPYSVKDEERETKARERFDQAIDLINRSEARIERDRLENERREEETRRREQEARENNLKAEAKERELQLMAEAKGREIALERGKARNMRLGLIAASILFVVSVGAGGLAYRQYGLAEAERKATVGLFMETFLSYEKEIKIIRESGAYYYSVQDNSQITRIAQACMFRTDLRDEAAAKAFLETKYDLCDALAGLYLTTKSEKDALQSGLKYAQEAHQTALRLAKLEPSEKAQFKLAKAYLRLGDAYLIKGDITTPDPPDKVDTPSDPTTARTAFNEYLRVMQALAENDKALDKEEWQRELSQAYDRVGDLAVTVNDLKSAKESYSKKEQVTLRMIKYHEKDTDQSSSIYWNGDEALNHLNLGDIDLLLDQHENAHARFKDLIEIATKLNAKDPSNKWQWYLALGHERLADTMIKNGWKKRLAGETTSIGNDALDHYQKFLTLASDLATRDSENAKWQRGQAIAYERIGDAYILIGQLDKAERHYQTDAAIAQSLLQNDAANTDFKRDVAISQMKLGDVFAARGQWDKALEKYGDYQGRADELVKADVGNADWQRDYAVSFAKMGNVLLELKKTPEAKAKFADCIEVVDKFKKSIKSYDPRNDLSLPVRELCEAGKKKAGADDDVQPSAGTK